MPDLAELTSSIQAISNTMPLLIGQIAEHSTPIVKAINDLNESIQDMNKCHSKEMAAKKTYLKTAQGTSNNGDLQEAINNATINAIDSTRNTDTKICWKLENITGVSGSSTSDPHEITVSISFNVA